MLWWIAEELQWSPPVAVFTNILPNHIDWNSVLAIDFDAGVREQLIDDVGEPRDAPPPPLLRRIAFLDPIGSGWFDLGTGQAHRAAVLPDPEAPAAINAINLGVTHVDNVSASFPQLVVRTGSGALVSSLPLSGELLAVTVYRRGARAVALTLARLAVGLDLEGGAR